MKYARTQYDELKTRAMAAEEESSRLLKERKMDGWKAEATER